MSPHSGVIEFSSRSVEPPEEEAILSDVLVLLVVDREYPDFAEVGASIPRRRKSDQVERAHREVVEQQ